jgi:SNF2 family DNA or RNA helicase
MSDYLSGEWLGLVADHVDPPPLQKPDGMKITPHDYLLKDAAQMLHGIQSQFKGCLNGDHMSMGKTLEATLVMHHLLDKPGFSLVVCPASLLDNWEDSIAGYYHEVCPLSIFANVPQLTTNKDALHMFSDSTTVISLHTISTP